ncbi:MAG: hypothetical protein J5I90_22620 [Caldilineales bacterium]|nr:hypothetical protein [Caldilineales bacterium]
METTQLAQMVNWLDEQHRRDRAEIAKLQQRVESQTNEIQEQARRVKELEARLTNTQSQLGRFTQLEQALQNLKNEVTLLVNNQMEETTRVQREQERARLADREVNSRAIAELRKEMPRFRVIEEDLAVRKAEERRLSEIVIELRQETANLHKEIEDRTGTIPYLAEQRTHDNRRIVQIQQENVELFKRAEDAGSKLQMLEQKNQKLEGTVQGLPPIVDNLKRSQEQFIDSLKLADADRQRQMREWGETLATHEKQMDANRQRLQEFAAVYEESKRSLAALEKFQERLQRDQSQVAELQRLSEERLKKEMANFVAENEKLWKKQLLEWQYRWDQQDKTNARVSDRFPHVQAQLDLHDTLLQFLWRVSESQSSAQLSAAQRWLEDIQKLASQREKLLKKYEEDQLQPA